MKKRKKNNLDQKMEPDGICITLYLYGNAKQVVLKKIDQVKEDHKVKKYGKQSAIQSLLEELFKIKYSNLLNRASTSSL